MEGRVVKRGEEFRNSVFDETAGTKSGYLQKKSKAGLYQKRYFVVSSHYLR